MVVEFHGGRIQYARQNLITRYAVAKGINESPFVGEVAKVFFFELKTYFNIGVYIWRETCPQLSAVRSDHQVIPRMIDLAAYIVRGNRITRYRIKTFKNISRGNTVIFALTVLISEIIQQDSPFFVRSVVQGKGSHHVFISVVLAAVIENADFYRLVHAAKLNFLGFRNHLIIVLGIISDKRHREFRAYMIIQKRLTIHIPEMEIRFLIQGIQEKIGMPPRSAKHGRTFIVPASKTSRTPPSYHTGFTGTRKFPRLSVIE